MIYKGIKFMWRVFCESEIRQTESSAAQRSENRLFCMRALKRRRGIRKKAPGPFGAGHRYLHNFQKLTTFPVASGLAPRWAA
ncbi:hypothetical protein, partial [Pseudomonas mucidolens]|uniref:hypothetical protein n=1 Tax=Pseudomonas mucidolens TaxID=46679 RepID=UPI001C3F7289